MRGWDCHCFSGKQLAEGVRELAEQMVQGKVSLAVAGGIDDPARWVQMPSRLIRRSRPFIATKVSLS